MNNKDSAKRIALSPAMNGEPARLETINAQLDSTALESCIGGQLIVPGPPVRDTSLGGPLFPGNVQPLMLGLGLITFNPALVGIAVVNPTVGPVLKSTP
jgi:hypothetical protein